MNLKNKTALVSGANRGLGEQFVHALLDRGASRVYAAARDLSSLQGLLDKTGDKVVAVQLDICDPASIARCLQSTSDVDVLVNNAGINCVERILQPRDAQAAQHEMATNYFGTLAMCRAYAPLLIEKRGAIINMLSILARASLPMMGSLCASKAAALSATSAMRAELRDAGVHVLAVLPGAIDTDMSRDFPPPKMPAREVADAALDALVAGIDEVYPGDMAAGIAAGLLADRAETQAELAKIL